MFVFSVLGAHVGLFAARSNACFVSWRYSQLYVYRDRVLTTKIIRRAEAAGFSAIVLTVDTPVLGT